MQLTLELQKLLPPTYKDADVTYHEDDVEETLSLSDLPITKPNKENQETLLHTQNGDPIDDSDFDFGSLLESSIPAFESDMCIADEVFSGGQILPFRVLNRTRVGSCSSSSSRNSSSTRTSHQSINSSTTSTTTTTATAAASSSNSRVGLPDPKPRNGFYSYPSPNARVQKSTPTLTSASKSTMWQVLRLGLVRTPEIGLQGRTNIYINKFSNKNNSLKIGDLLCELPRRNNNGGGFFKSCKCAVGGIIEPLPPTGNNGNSNPGLSVKSLASQVLNDKEQIGQNEKGRGKERMSNHRTFEWLRDL